MHPLKSSKPSEIRDALDGRIGEIISAVIGDKTLQEIFEQPENHEQFIEANAKGTPSAFIAMDLGIIDKDTKTALLVAQAAERMMRRCEAIQDIAAGRATGVDSALALKEDDEVFKFVGSERDPAELREAQAGWQITQIMLNKAVNAAGRNDIRATHNLTRATAGFQNLAANYVEASAATLKDKGFSAGAEKLKNLAQELKAIPLGAGHKTPHSSIAALAATAHDDGSKTLYTKLAGLTEHQSGGANAPTQAAKAKPAGL